SAARFSDQRFHRIEQRLRLQHHAFAAAKRAVIHGPVPVVREFAQILDANLHQSSFARAPHDAEIQRPREELRKNCDDVKTHRISLSAGRKSHLRGRFILHTFADFSMLTTCSLLTRGLDASPYLLRALREPRRSQSAKIELCVAVAQRSRGSATA